MHHGCDERLNCGESDARPRRAKGAPTRPERPADDANAGEVVVEPVAEGGGRRPAGSAPAPRRQIVAHQNCKIQLLENAGHAHTNQRTIEKACSRAQGGVGNRMSTVFPQAAPGRQSRLAAPAFGLDITPGAAPAAPIGQLGREPEDGPHVARAAKPRAAERHTSHGPPMRPRTRRCSSARRGAEHNCGVGAGSVLWSRACSTASRRHHPAGWRRLPAASCNRLVAEAGERNKRGFRSMRTGMCHGAADETLWRRCGHVTCRMSCSTASHTAKTHYVHVYRNQCCESYANYANYADYANYANLMENGPKQ
eukprot:352454-Chlamydomonas_euryale.AAC.8